MMKVTVPRRCLHTSAQLKKRAVNAEFLFPAIGGISLQLCWKVNFYISLSNKQALIIFNSLNHTTTYNLLPFHSAVGFFTRCRIWQRAKTNIVWEIKYPLAECVRHKQLSLPLSSAWIRYLSNNPGTLQIQLMQIAATWWNTNGQFRDIWLACQWSDTHYFFCCKMP